MQIVYIANSVVPSSAANSVHVMKMCQALALNGHKVLLIIPHVKNSPIEAKNYEFYGVKPIFEIQRIHCPDIKGQRYIFGLKSVLKAKKNKIDLIYTRFLPACYLALKFKIPTIYESHIPENNQSRLFTQLIKSAVKSPFLKKIVVISSYLKKYYSHLYPQIAAKILIAHDGADIPQANESDIFENHSKINIGYIGSLFTGRGIDIIIEIAKRSQGFHFHIIGGNDLDISFWKQQCESVNNISFYGHVPPSQVQKYGLNCDVLLAPYQQNLKTHGHSSVDTSPWMSPLKIFEYMSYKKPIIASNLPAIKEILQHEHNCLLCDPTNINDWVTSLNHLKDNPAFCQKLSLNAYNDFILHYTWQKRASLVLS